MEMGGFPSTTGRWEEGGAFLTEMGVNFQHALSEGAFLTEMGGIPSMCRGREHFLRKRGIYNEKLITSYSNMGTKTWIT